MSLINTIKKDQVQARKDRNAGAATLLTTLLGEASMVGKNAGGRETTDDEVIAVVKKFIKNNNDTLAVIDNNSSGYGDIENENELLNRYLPTQLSEDELRDIIAPLAEGKTMRDMGSIMKELKTNYTGLYDGGVASSIIKGMLQ